MIYMYVRIYKRMYTYVHMCVFVRAWVRACTCVVMFCTRTCICKHTPTC